MKLAIGAAVLGICPQVLAHGFGERYDLPVPLWLWVAGAGATIILTFAIVATFFRGHRPPSGPRWIDLFRWQAFRVFAHWVPVGLLRLVAVVLLVATGVSGFQGQTHTYQNLAPKKVWLCLL